MIKKLLTLFAGVALVAPMALAQVDTGTSSGAVALDRARSGPVAVASTPTTTETVTVSDGKSLSKKVVVEEEAEKLVVGQRLHRMGQPLHVPRRQHPRQWPWYLLARR